MKKIRTALILLPILICSLILFACSEPGIDLNSAKDVNLTTTAETTTIETTSAAAKVQNDKTSEKVTIPAQSTEQINHTEIKADDADPYEEFDDYYYDEPDYDQSYYEEQELKFAQEYEQNYYDDPDYDEISYSEDNDDVTNDYHPEDPEYPKKEYKHHHTFNLIDYEQADCGHITCLYACDCGETKTEEIHVEDSEGNWLLEEVEHWIDYDENGTQLGELWKLRCPVCGFEEIWGTD